MIGIFSFRHVAVISFSLTNINGRIKYIKDNLPECEILLVSSFIGNPWVFNEELYKADEIISVKDPYLNHTYIEGVD